MKRRPRLPRSGLPSQEIGASPIEKRAGLWRRNITTQGQAGARERFILESERSEASFISRTSSENSRASEACLARKLRTVAPADSTVFDLWRGRARARKIDRSRPLQQS